MQDYSVFVTHIYEVLIYEIDDQMSYTVTYCLHNCLMLSSIKSNWVNSLQILSSAGVSQFCLNFLDSKKRKESVSV